MGTTRSTAIVAPSAPITEPQSGSVRPGVGTYLLRGLLALSMIYYAWLVLDLVLHPFGPEVYDGAFVVGRSLWVLVGTSVIVLGAFIMRRVPGNIVGPLLILWGVSITANATREDLGLPLLTSLTHLSIQLFSSVVAAPAIIVLIVCFPTGQVYPRGLARLVRLWVILLVITAILDVLSKSPGGPVTSGELDFPLNRCSYRHLLPITPCSTGRSAVS